MSEPLRQAALAEPTNGARPVKAIAALVFALIVAVAGAVGVQRAARRMPPLPAAATAPAGRAEAGRRPAGPAAPSTRPGGPPGGGGARPEYPRLQ
jgi:hypothetical protein